MNRACLASIRTQTTAHLVASAFLAISVGCKSPTPPDQAGKPHGDPAPVQTAPAEPMKAQREPQPLPRPTPMPKDAFSFMGFFLGQNETDVRRIAETHAYELSCKPAQQGVQKCKASLHPGAESERSGPAVFLFSLIDGRVYLIQYGFPSDDYSGIETALLQKYGDPARVVMKEAHQGLGTVPSKNSAWVRGLDMLLLTERNPDGGTFSTVKLANSPNFQEAAARGMGDGPAI